MALPIAPSPISVQAPQPAVCGTAASDFDIAEVAGLPPLTLADFGIPEKRKYCPAQLEEFCEGEPSARTWQRECERGAVRAVKIGGVWWIPYGELFAYFLRQGNVISAN